MKRLPKESIIHVSFTLHFLVILQNPDPEMIRLKMFLVFTNSIICPNFYTVDILLARI